MGKNLLAAGVVCLLTVAGCSKVGSQASTASAMETTVTLDLATPDKALKSYWVVRDSIRRKQFELFVNGRSAYQATETQLASVAEGSLATELAMGVNPPETFSRDLIDVKVESESRAVIVVAIKNTTPIPAGAELSKYDEEWRRDGTRYRYVLEKSQTGWRISEIWEWSTYPKTDWKKLLPGDGKPYVPSLASNGI